MGFFDKFKSERDIVKEEIIEVPWHLLTSIEQLDEAVEISKTKTVVLFKHSTSCGISKMVLRNFEKNFNLDANKVVLYFLDLKQYRDISDQIANRFKVQHESPQLLVLKNGNVVHHDSHQGIDVNHLQQYL